MSLSPIGSNDRKPAPRSAIIIQVRDDDYPHLWWDVPTWILSDSTPEQFRAEMARQQKRFPRNEYRLIVRTVSETVL